MTAKESKTRGGMVRMVGFGGAADGRDVEDEGSDMSLNRRLLYSITTFSQ